MIDSGDQPFQPIWAEDLGKAIAMAVERKDLATRTLELAGTEETTMNDVLDRFATITGKDPARIPVPGFLATLGAKAAGMFGVDLPVDVVSDNPIEPTEEEAPAPPAKSGRS